MAAGVVELVTLEVDFGTANAAGSRRDLAQVLRQPFREIKRARPAGVVRVELRQLLLKPRIGLGRRIGALKVENQRHQGLGDKAAAEQAEEAPLVGTAAVGVALVALCLHFWPLEPPI